MESSLRLVPLTAALTFALAALNVPAQDTRLPDIGSSAGEVLGPAQQAEYGAMTLSQLRHYGYVLDDPLIEGWLQGVGHRLVAAGAKPVADTLQPALEHRHVDHVAAVAHHTDRHPAPVTPADREEHAARSLRPET